MKIELNEAQLNLLYEALNYRRIEFISSAMKQINFYRASHNQETEEKLEAEFKRTERLFERTKKILTEARDKGRKVKETAPETVSAHG